MGPILISAAVMAGLGLSLALVLSLAAHAFHLQEDPRVESIVDILPGANCGGCGFAGCSDYAQAIVQRKAASTLCIGTETEDTQTINALVGLCEEPEERKVARIFCQGDMNKAHKRFAYAGAKDCRAAIMATGGDTACEYGCIGLGSCVRACPYLAMRMGPTGLPEVNTSVCTGCGKCMQVCPRNILRLLPRSQPTANLCSSPDKGKGVSQACTIGCIACGICIKECPHRAITMVDNLARIDPHTCAGTKTCVDKCPTGAMVDLFQTP